MDLAFLIVIALMLGLYIWSHLSAGHRVSKKIQRFVDDFFGVSPRPNQKPRDDKTK